MKTNKYILLLLFPLLLLQYGCKKDYPRDIPKWLKAMIKERKSECKDRGCDCTNLTVGCWRVLEIELAGDIYYYRFSNVYPYYDYLIYDEQGELYCEEHSTIFLSDANMCNGAFQNAKGIRIVWGQSCECD